MDKMVDLKNLTKSEVEVAASAPSAPKYPWGMQLRFDSDTMPKFPELSGMDVGGKVRIVGIGEVTSISKNESKDGGKNECIEIQIVKLAVDSEDSFDSAFEKAVKGD